METVMEDQEDEFAGAEEVLDISQLCRACASPNEYLIPIFHGEGLQYDLKHKVSRLPLQIKETDKLPVQLCYQCASTLIAFSDLVEGCAEADAKLKSLLPEGSSDPTTSLDDQTGLQSDEKSLGLQSSAASSIVETSQKVSPELNAEGVAEQDVSSMDQEDIAIEPMQQRFSNPFYLYRQIESVVREKLLTPDVALFCIHCGQIELSLPELMKHMNVRHQMTFEHCQGKFVNEIQLSAHQTIHHMLESEVKIDNNKPENSRQRSLRNTRTTQLKNKRHPLKKVLVQEYMNEQSNLEGSKLRDRKAKNKQECKKKEPEGVGDVFSEDSINSDDIRSYLATKKEASSTVEDGAATGYDGSASPCHSVDNDVGDSLIDSLTTAETEEFSCSYCTSLFQSKKELVKHEMVHHSAERLKSIQAKFTKTRRSKLPKQCEICMKTFGDRRDLMRHMTVHGGVKQATCEICGKQFSHNRYLFGHIRRVHQKIKNHACDICGRMFNDTKTRNDHRRSHTGEKPFVCEVCGKAFATHTTIYIHRRSHTDNFPHQCTTCNKRYRTRGGLTVHIRSHTGEMPFSCELCDKRFSDPSQMRRHKETHSTDKPYVCVLCGVRFNVKRYLKRHMDKHAELGQHPVYLNPICENPVYQTL